MPQRSRSVTGAHVQASKQFNAQDDWQHETSVRSLDVLASMCRVHETTNHSQDHDFVSGISKHSNLTQDRGRVVSAHQQQTDNTAPWSMTSEVPTSNPSQP